MIYKLKMGSDTVCYIKSDLKNKFSYFKFEKDTVFQRNKADKNNNLVFILHGEMEVIYGDLYPRLISGGNMILLSDAEIAQLVEHNLAKVRVASSSLVFRSSVCCAKVERP